MEIREHRSELGQWQTAQRPADPRLRAYVHGYFASRATFAYRFRNVTYPSSKSPFF